MTPTADDGGWGEFHKRAAVLALPQVPNERIIRRFSELVASHDERVLLLGVTRALAGLGTDLTTVDISAKQIQHMWPGDTPARRAILGDWREMELPPGAFTAAIGDGSLSALAWPDDYRDVLGRVAQALQPGGVVVIRCFITPDAPETVEQVAGDVLSGRETDAHATRWRIAMAAAHASGAIAARDLAAVWRRVFPPLPELARRTGWSLEAMELLFGSLERATLRYSFVTQGAVLDMLPATLTGARFVPSGDYPLSERCPFLVAERAG